MVIGQAAALAGYCAREHLELINSSEDRRDGDYGDRRVDQTGVVFAGSLERHAPSEQLLGAIDRFVDL